MLKLKRSFALGAGVVLLAVVFPVALGAQDKLPFSAEELSRLAKGEVVIRVVEKEGPDKVVSSMLVAAVLVRHPPEVIWEVLNHPEREIEWIPNVKKSALVGDTCTSPTTRENVTDYVLGAFGLEAYYSTVRVYDYENMVIKAHMDKTRPSRFFKDIKSGWDFYPYKDGTIFQYWSDSKLVIDIKLPAFLSDALAEKTLVMGVEAVAERCNVIAKEMKGKDIPLSPCQARPKKEPAEQ